MFRRVPREQRKTVEAAERVHLVGNEADACASDLRAQSIVEISGGSRGIITVDGARYRRCDGLRILCAATRSQCEKGDRDEQRGAPQTVPHPYETVPSPLS
jgi:hypothetical protein